MKKLVTENAYFINGICIPKLRTFCRATPKLFWLVWLLCIFAIMLGWLQFLNPQPLVQGEWFQRAGSLVVGLALMAEFSSRHAIKELVRSREAPNNFINKTGLGLTNDQIELNKMRDVATLGSIEKVCECINILFVFLGTIIWGYGDIIFYKIAN
jgi:hypothetical protein